MPHTKCSGRPPQKRSDVLKQALAAAERGFAVFPLRGKAPQTKRGYKDASSDRARVYAMFNAAPQATGYGIATGKASGVVVVDIDGPEGQAEAKRRGLRSEYVVRTGRGFHLYYAPPDGVALRSCALAPGVELKAEGCYVVGPGSAHPAGGTYTVVKSGAPSPTPAWVAAAGAEHQTSRARPAGGNVAPLAADVDGPPIPEGTRNDALASIAGRLHDGSRDLAQLTADLLAFNEARCAPPLDEREVCRIAKSIYGREPCKPRSSGPGPTPEVLEIIGGVEAALDSMGWAKQGDHTDTDFMVALCRIARQRGSEIRAGVRVEASIRQIIEEAGIGSTRTGHKAINRLRKSGWIRRDGTGSGTKSGALVILRRAEVNTGPPGGRLRGAGDASVYTCAPPRSAPRLRWSAPGHAGRLGKCRGRVVDVLEHTGGLDIAGLADALAGADGKRPRVRDLKRRTLSQLLAAGVVECVAGQYRLAAAWREALHRRRVEDGEIEAARLQRRRHRDQSNAFREAWARGEVISKAEFARRRRNRDRIRPEERHVSGTVAELECVVKPNPALVRMLRTYLMRNPHRHGESPSWLSTALWADLDLTEKPPLGAVELALCELREAA